MTGSAPRYRITITSTDRDAMLDLVRTHHIEVFDHGIRYVASVGYSVDAAADSSEIATLRAAGYALRKHEDLGRRGKARQKEVGKGDRYERAGPTAP